MSIPLYKCSSIPPMPEFLWSSFPASPSSSTLSSVKVKVASSSLESIRSSHVAPVVDALRDDYEGRLRAAEADLERLAGDAEESRRFAASSGGKPARELSERLTFASLLVARLRLCSSKLRNLSTSRLSGRVLLYPPGASMPAHTDSIVGGRDGTDLGDVKGMIRKEFIAIDWFCKGDAIDSKVLSYLQSLPTSPRPSGARPDILARQPRHAIPPVPEYVVTLSYGLSFSYLLDSDYVGVPSDTGVVMDANNVMHGVAEVGGGTGVRIGDGEWRVAVVVWEGDKPREIINEQLDIAGLFD